MEDHDAFPFTPTNEQCIALSSQYLFPSFCKLVYNGWRNKTDLLKLFDELEKSYFHFVDHMGGLHFDDHWERVYHIGLKIFEIYAPRRLGKYESYYKMWRKMMDQQPKVGVLIISEKKQLYYVREKMSGLYGYPKGRLNFGESVEDGALREGVEESPFTLSELERHNTGECIEGPLSEWIGTSFRDKDHHFQVIFGLEERPMNANNMTVSQIRELMGGYFDRIQNIVDMRGWNVTKMMTFAIYPLLDYFY